MPMWTNTDGTNDDKPKYVRNNPVYDDAQAGDTSGTGIDNVFGADPDEVAANNIAHSGWVLKKTKVRQPGNVSSVQYEVLVALSGMTSTLDHDEALLTPFGAGSSSSSSGTI